MEVLVVADRDASLGILDYHMLPRYPRYGGGGDAFFWKVSWPFVVILEAGRPMTCTHSSLLFTSNILDNKAERGFGLLARAAKPSETAEVH